MPLSARSLRNATATIAIALGGLACTAAHAENHALIMWVGQYRTPANNLPGIDIDARNARAIAETMGVPRGNIVEIGNQQLTRTGIARALESLTSRIREGDKVFVYYSGHGYQSSGSGGAQCAESLVAHDEEFFSDRDLEGALTRLGERASQVVMMNDSCFSGGAATKSLEGTRGSADAVPKFFPGMQATTAVGSGYQCNRATNKETGSLGRNLEIVEARSRGANVLYVAASNDTQVSFATSNGSVGTNAWLACLRSSSADTDRSGSVSGTELQACAQREIDRAGFRQTVMLQGATNLPLSFAGKPPGTGGATVDPSRTLQDLAAAADRSFAVELIPAKSSLQVRQDFLDFTVRSSRDGYLYLLQVGSDGKTFNLLFPNNIDKNNRITAGTHNFPRSNWRVRAAGPAGTSHILAIVSPVQKDMSKDMDTSGAIPTTRAIEEAAKTLIVEATGAAGGNGRYGASAVVAIREVN